MAAVTGQILAVGLPVRTSVVLQIDLTPLPGFIDAATPTGMVLSWLEDVRYHITVCRGAHRRFQDKWWAIYHKYHGQEAVLWIHHFGSGMSEELSYHGVGVDEDVLFLRRLSDNWYKDSALHVSM